MESMTWLVGREPVNDSVAMVSFDGRVVVPNLRLRELTLRRRLLLSVDEVVANPQRVPARLRGLLPHGNSARSFGQLDEYAIERLALFLAKRHKRKRGYGYWRIARSPDRMGLIRITGTGVAPRPNRAWTG
jgi:hypothetical protein